MALCLIGRYDSPLVRCVRISLHGLGMRFERLALSVFSNADELRAYDPVGRVPALVPEDGGTLIWIDTVRPHFRHPPI